MHKVEHSLFKYFKYTHVNNIMLKINLLYFGLPALILIFTRQTMFYIISYYLNILFWYVKMVVL